jgi:hypothetical protein
VRDNAHKREGESVRERRVPLGSLTTPERTAVGSSSMRSETDVSGCDW